MRRIAPSMLLAGLFACAAATAAIAQDRQPEEERVVRALDDQERLAALRRDIPALERLWAEDFVVNAPNNRVVVGREAVLETFVRAGVIDFDRFEREIEFARVEGGPEGSYVVLMGLETIRPLSSSPGAGLVAGQVVTRRFTNIWRKETDGAWRLAIRHANVFAGR